MADDTAEMGGDLGLEQYQAIFEKAPDGLLVVDGGSGTILLANEAGRSMFGPGDKVRPGAHISTIFPDEARGPVQDALDQVKVVGSCFVQRFQGAGGDQTMDLTATLIPWSGGRKVILAAFRDTSERAALTAEREALIAQLKRSVARIEQLSGLLPICASCKKIRDDSGYWHRVESYLTEFAEAKLTHGICPQCAAEHYPGLKYDTSVDQPPRDDGEEPNP